MVAPENIYYLEKALIYFEKAVQCNPNNKITLRNLGMTLISIYDSGHSVHVYSQFSYYITRAESYFIQAIKVRKFLEFFTKIHKIDPKDAHSLYQYSEFLSRSERIEESIEYMLAALSVKPTHGSSLVQLTFILGQLEFYEALKKLDQLNKATKS